MLYLIVQKPPVNLLQDMESPLIALSCPSAALYAFYFCNGQLEWSKYVTPVRAKNGHSFVGECKEDFGYSTGDLESFTGEKQNEKPSPTSTSIIISTKSTATTTTTGTNDTGNDQIKTITSI